MGILCALVLFWGQDLTLPEIIKGDVAAFVTVSAETTGKTVKFVALDPGLSVFPPGLLSNPKVTVVSSAKPGVFRLLAYTAAGDMPSDPVICKVVIGNTPIDPPPGPGPNPPEPQPVDPPPGPAPIPLDGLRVLMVYDADSLARLPAAQHSIFFSAEVRKYLNEHCAKGPSGTAEWRLYPKSVDNSADLPHWRAAMARERKSLPWIVISNGKAGYEGPLPANIAEALELLKKYGGA